MNLKRLSLAVLVVLVLGAVGATSALAGTAVTRKASWTTGTTKNANTIPTGKANAKAINCRKTAGSENFALTGTVAGSEAEITASGIECVGMSIFNENVSGVPMAFLTGKLKLTGVKAVKPAGCKTPATLETKLLTGVVQMDANVTQKIFVKWEPDPVAGETSFASVKIEECAAEGTYPVKGASYCELTNQTEVHATVQECNSGLTTALMSFLTWGPSPAKLAGEITFELTAGGAFGLEEF